MNRWISIVIITTGVGRLEITAIFLVDTILIYFIIV